MRNQIRQKFEEKYAPWDISFSTTNPGGVFSRVTFNEGFSGGVAQQIDFRNLDPDDTAVVNVAGLGANTTSQIIEASATVGAHELGHLLGFRHGDGFGPIGSGLGSPGPGSGSYLPAFPGPSGGNEVNNHVMATPAYGANNLLRNTFLSERSAIKMEFAFDGTVISEAAGSKSTLATAQPIDLFNLTVPNTIVTGDNAGLGDFSVDAVSVLGNLSTSGQVDIYSFSASADDLFNVEVMSSAINQRISNTIDSQITLMDSSGDPISYWGNTSTGAFNDDEFESLDSILIDVSIPSDGTYYLQVNPWSASDRGGYELFVHRFNGEADEFAVCDFDENGLCNIVDIDMLYVALGSSDATFDLDGNGIVNNDDLTDWLSEASAVDALGRTFVRGDTDLDGDVLGDDFTLLAANFGGPGSWGQGNFVVDAVSGGGDVLGADFTILAGNFGFDSTVTAVPEPGSLLLVGLSLVLLPWMRRRS